MNVAAVIPTWNRRKEVLRLLESIAALAVRPQSVVVVDNASDDGTAETVAGAFPETIVLRQEFNRGSAGGFNVGLCWAMEHGLDHAWLLDSDALAERDILASLLDACSDPSVGAAGSAWLREGPDDVADGVGARINFLTGELTTLCRNCPVSQLPGRPFDVDCVCNASALVSLMAVKRCGLMRTDYFVFFDDVEFYMRLGRAGFRVLAVPGSHVRHRAGGPRRFTPVRLYYMLRNMVDFFLCYAPRVSRFLIAVRQFTGIERLARSCEAAGLAEHAAACRLALEHARDGVLGPCDGRWGNAEACLPDPRAPIFAPLAVGASAALRAKRRGPPSVPFEGEQKS